MNYGGTAWGEKIEDKNSNWMENGNVRCFNECAVAPLAVGVGRADGGGWLAAFSAEPRPWGTQPRAPASRCLPVSSVSSVVFALCSLRLSVSARWINGEWRMESKEGWPADVAGGYLAVRRPNFLFFKGIPGIL
jgi:hypothetical protein